MVLAEGAEVVCVAARGRALVLVERGRSGAHARTRRQALVLVEDAVA